MMWPPPFREVDFSLNLLGLNSRGQRWEANWSFAPFCHVTKNREFADVAPAKSINSRAKHFSSVLCFQVPLFFLAVPAFDDP